MTEIATTYGQALYELAKDEGLSAELLAQLGVVGELFAQNGDFVRLLQTHRSTILKTENGWSRPYQFRDLDTPDFC